MNPANFLFKFKIHVMKKEDLLSDEFLSQFKNGEELKSFLST